MLPYLPLLIWRAAHPIRSLAGALGFAGLVTVQGLTSPYVAAASLAPLGVLGAWRLLGAKSRRAGWFLLTAVLVASAALAVAYAGYVWIRLQEPTLSGQTYWPAAHNKAFAVPGDFRDPRSPLAIPLAALALIAFGGFVAGVRRLRRGPAERRDLMWRHGLLWVVVGVTIALPATLSVRGHELSFPPAALLASLPGFDLMRDTYRMGTGALVALCLLAGVAFAECAEGLRLAPKVPVRLASAAVGVMVIVLSVLMYRGYAAAGWTVNGRFVPLADDYDLVSAVVPDSSVMRHLRRPGGPLLELPVRAEIQWFMLMAQTNAMYRSLFHPRPVLNGYTSYWPSGFQDRMQLASQLPDPVALAALRRHPGVELVLVQLDFMPMEHGQAWRALAETPTRSDLQLVASTPNLLLFQVR
jgi:hypothetical protein